MKKMIGIFVAVVFCCSLIGAVALYAEDSVNGTMTSTKEELTADKQKIKAEKEEMKANALSARSEEKDLRAQIKEAELAGDKEKAKELRGQLKGLHHENIQEMKTDKKSLHEARKEFRQNRKEARHSRN